MRVCETFQKITGGELNKIKEYFYGFVYYNVHGLVEISIDARCNFIKKFDHQLRQFNDTVSKSARSEVTILPYSDYQSHGNYDICFDYMRCSATEVPILIVV